MVNKAQLIGNVGQDPQVTYLDSGVAVANFSLATNETYKDKEGNKQTRTEWHKIVAWRQLAEIIEKYVKQGSKLYIEGKIRTRKYKDKEGNERYTTEIYADQMVMLDSKGSGEGGQQKAQSQVEYFDDDGKGQPSSSMGDNGEIPEPDYDNGFDDGMAF